MTLGMPMAREHFVHVLGVRFHRISTRQAVEQILHWISEKSRRMVITAGPEFVMKTLGDEGVKRLAHAADMVTPDGIGIVWAARRQGIDGLARVTGVELVENLLASAQERGQSLRVYVLGTSPTAHRSCMAYLAHRFPGMTFAGHHGFFGPDEWKGICSDMETFAPDLWLVGMGQPRQEQLIFDTLASLPPCVGIGVGGSLDVWGGTVTRAPRFVQKMNLEWLYRLVRQPSRWRRQLALPRFAWKVLRNPAHKT